MKRVDQSVTARWEWRAFAPSFDLLDPLMPPKYDIAHDIQVLAAGSAADVRVCDGAIVVNTLDTTDRGLALWRPSFRATFPLCHREIRTLCEYLSVPQPHTLFRPCDSEPDFLTDIACCTGGVHVVGVNTTRRAAMVDGCRVERATVSAAGEITQTAAVESTDASAVLRVIQRLRLDRFDSLNYVDFLKRLLGRQFPGNPGPSIATPADQPRLARRIPA
jgi:hypothetical protein